MSTFAIERELSTPANPYIPLPFADTIILPAGGPWFIHGIWCNCIERYQIPGWSKIGYLTVDSVSGDITPDPAPGKYPFFCPGATSELNESNPSIPTIIHPVLWEAAGKSKIKFSVTCTSGGVVNWYAFAGIIFGDRIPRKRPRIFCDTVSGRIDSTDEMLIGTITLSEKARKITAILGDVVPTNDRRDDEYHGGYFRLDSDDVELNPSQFPFCRMWPATTVGGEGSSSVPLLNFIDVDIDVNNGARINVYVKVTKISTHPINCNIFIAYE